MARILVFDSGVGGLSILASMQKMLSTDTHLQHQWLFCSDNACFPYGTKDEDMLISRVSKVIKTLYSRFQPDIIVIACNTASTVALEETRQLIPVPVVGVVPAIKPAAALSASRSIGLLATSGTINRSYTQKLINDFANDREIISVGSGELVQMAEGYLRGEKTNSNVLGAILEPFRDAILKKNMDTVVLACTHFPLLIEALSEQLPEIKHWVDSGDAIARRVDWLLKNQVDTKSMTTGNNHNIALFTRLDGSALVLQNTLEKFNLHEMQELALR